MLICDDEQIVRQGLKYIIDWNELGFRICDEAENGEVALSKIEKYRPGIVLMDIRMPKLSGLELIEMVRNNGYTGEFIILSGYSDFTYAQTAIKFGVSSYLTKPIDEDELTDALLAAKERINNRRNRELSIREYVDKAKTPVLDDLFTGSGMNPTLNYQEMGLDYPVYQVVMFSESSETFNHFNFAGFLKVANRNNSCFEEVSHGDNTVILLKGSYALEHFENSLALFENDPRGLIPDDVVMTYGPPVYSLETIRDSYSACGKLMDNRFFFDENQNLVSWQDLPDIFSSKVVLDADRTRNYADLLCNYIQVCNRRKITDVLTQMKADACRSGQSATHIKYFCTDVFLQIMQNLKHAYKSKPLILPGNADVIREIESRQFLYQVLLYYTENFEKIIFALGNQSGESLFDDILDYISRNYGQALKLENIAPLFGYNSSYLGKLFKQKTGENFNNYLDKLRISEATSLLKETDMRVYEIASKVGYRNVDYFHQKFKKQTGESPAEYRRTHPSVS